MPAPTATAAPPAAVSAPAALKSARGGGGGTTITSPSKRGATITLSEQLPILRQLITAQLAPTSSPPPPAVSIPAQQAPPAKGAAATAAAAASATAAAAAAAASRPPSAPSPPITYPWSFTLPYYPSPSHFLTRFVLSRVDEDSTTNAANSKQAKADPKRNKIATTTALPPTPVELPDPNVTLTLHCPSATACLLHIYDYDEWQHSTAPTHTLLSATAGDVDGRMRIERRVVGEGDVVVENVTLVRERPLLVEAYLDPFHISPELVAFHTQQQLKRTTLPTPPASLLSTATSTTALPTPSPSSKSNTAKKLTPAAAAAAAAAASTASDVEEVVRDSWPIVLDVLAMGAGGVTVALDVTSEEKRKERKTEREKAEPGRARRARAARERWLEEAKKRKETVGPEEESKEQMLVEQWPDENDTIILVSRDERHAEKQRRAAEAEEAQSFRYVLGELRRIQVKVEDDADKEDEKRWKEWREREAEAVQREKAERAQLRAQQQQEENDMQAVRTIIAARTQEREAERERKAAEPNTQRSEAAKPDKAAAKAPAAAKGAKDAKAAKAEPISTPRKEQTRLDRRREYFARLEAAVQALLAVDGSRQWKVRGLVEQVREEERREAREECELCVAAADSALAQGEVDEVEEKVDEEPMTQRKDGKPAKAAGKDPKAEKAEKERKEAEKKAKEDRDRKRKDDKLQSITALNDALQFSEEVSTLAGNAEHEQMKQEAKQRGQEKVRGEVSELMARMDKAEQLENEELEKLKAASATILSPTSAGRTSTLTTSRPSSASLQPPTSARRPAAGVAATAATPTASTAGDGATAGSESDLVDWLAVGYGSQLSRLQLLSVFVSSLLCWLDSSDEARVQIRSACEVRLGELRRRWEAEVKMRQEEEAKAAAAAATTTAAKGKGKGK